MHHVFVAGQGTAVGHSKPCETELPCSTPRLNHLPYPAFTPSYPSSTGDLAFVRSRFIAVFLIVRSLYQVLTSSHFA